MAKEYRLTIPAIIEKVEEACDFVSDVARSIGMDDEAVHRCYLSVEEICINIIEHGYRNGGDEDVIDVKCWHQNNRLVITILDDADPFNPLDRPDPDPSAPLMERGRGGWGIYFVKKYMDQIDYRYARNRNQLTIEKHL